MGSPGWVGGGANHSLPVPPVRPPQNRVPHACSRLFLPDYATEDTVSWDGTYRGLQFAEKEPGQPLTRSLSRYYHESFTQVAWVPPQGVGPGRDFYQSSSCLCSDCDGRSPSRLDRRGHT